MPVVGRNQDERRFAVMLAKPLGQTVARKASAQNHYCRVLRVSLRLLMVGRTIHRRNLRQRLQAAPSAGAGREKRVPWEAVSSRRNRCTSSVYELGSLFKVVSAGMALESDAVSLHDRYDASEPLQIGRHRVRDYHGQNRWLTVPEIFAFSSNIATARMTFAPGGASTAPDPQATLRIVSSIPDDWANVSS